MQKILAVAWLTWKAALRFKLFLVIAVLLVLAVVGLPLMVKDDGTARGFTQIIVTYTLSSITVLLGISTLWLSCGALARDIEECQIQVVVTKPIARWQIWLGKWLGIVSLNAALLILAAACIDGMLEWRASRLPAAEQKDLREQVMVARGSAKEDFSQQIDAETEQVLQNRLKENPNATNVDLPEVRQEIRDAVVSDLELVPPAYAHQWRIQLGASPNDLRGRPMQLRIKFNAANGSLTGTYVGLWMVGNPESTNFVQLAPMSLAPDTFHEFSIPPNLCDSKGELAVVFLNENNSALTFPLDDGMEVLFPQGGFTVNFVRALAVIFFWLVLLSTIGMMAASFLSFPVAAFFSVTLLAVALSSGTLAETVSLGSVTQGSTPAPGHASLTDVIFIPIFKGMLGVLGLIENFSPIDALSSGRSIPWNEVGAAFGQIVLLFSGGFAVIGIFMFNRRELAAAQNQ